MKRMYVIRSSELIINHVMNMQSVFKTAMPYIIMIDVI